VRPCRLVCWTIPQHPQLEQGGFSSPSRQRSLSLNIPRDRSILSTLTPSPSVILIRTPIIQKTNVACVQVVEEPDRGQNYTDGSIDEVTASPAPWHTMPTVQKEEVRIRATLEPIALHTRVNIAQSREINPLPDIKPPPPHDSQTPTT
jgi:hypothetical protein